MTDRSLPARQTCDRLAVCQDPHGLHEHVEVEGAPPTGCFADCACSPRLYVAVDAVLAELRKGDSYGYGAPRWKRDAADFIERKFGT